MSAWITSRLIPSPGTKYSFWRSGRESYPGRPVILYPEGKKGSPRLNKVIKNHGSKWPQWKKSGTGQVQPRSKKMGKTKSSPRFGLIVLSCMEESKSRREVQFYLTVCVQGNSKADSKWLIRLFSSFLFLSRNKHTTQQAVRA